MVDVEAQVVVHGGDLHPVLQVFGQQALVGHVVVESVVQLDVHVADQRALHVLHRSRRKEVDTRVGVIQVFHPPVLNQPYLVQEIPGVIAGREEGVRPRALDLRPQLGAVGVTLGGAGFDRAQGAVQVVNRSHWEGGQDSRVNRETSKTNMEKNND